MCSENTGDRQRASGKLHVLEGVQGILNIHIPLPSLQVNGPKHNGLEMFLAELKSDYTIYTNKMHILTQLYTSMCISHRDASNLSLCLY